MKPTRILASATLIFSSLALITAAGISVGDEPGVVRMGSNPTQAGSATAPMPDPVSTGVAAVDGGPPAPDAGIYPQPAPYAPYFERSTGATQQLPNSAYQPKQPFGPIMMFETNIGDGLGYQDSYQRLNARVPYHIVPNANVLIGDISASVTNSGDPVANVGGIYRNYDSSLNRIFGWNAYGDYDQGYGNGDWYQFGAGLESLGKYIDFRANGYFVAGTDSRLLSSAVVGDMFQAGNNVFRTRNEVRDNAYSGFDVEVGGPLPVLGQYGINMYVGGYYLGNGNGDDAPGFQARWQALITESLRVNTYLTSDDTFGTNSWVSLQYDIPNYKNRRVLRDAPVRDRLSDPVYRSNRIHTNIDMVNTAEAQINPKTDLPFYISYVDPNASLAGNGTVERPYSTLQALANTNNAGIDVIRVTPRADDLGTNLTVNGGLTLFDCQALVSTIKPFPLFTTDGVEFGLDAVPTATGLGPLISDPTLVAGDSVIRLANANQVLGFRIDASNSTQTILGTGISNLLPIEDVTISMNSFTNYETAVNLQDVSGRAVLDMNTVNGIVMAAKNGAASGSALYSKQGLVLSSAAGQELELLVRNNSVNNSMFADPTGPTPATTTFQNDQTTVGISITAKQNSIIRADDPAGINSSGATGILNNIVTNSGDGIVLTALEGSRFDAVVENNQSYNNAGNGLMATADGGTFNLYSMSGNMFGGEDLNANGILDPSEDTNGDGILDTGEDKNSNRVLDPTEDANGNGVLDIGEDLNGNGILDLSEDANGNGRLDAGEDEDWDGNTRPAEDVNGDGLLAVGNGKNGAFLHYLNGGTFFAASEDVNDDLNFNGIRDNGELLGANGVFDVFNATLQAGEDRNGNGRLDLGIVLNNMTDNGIAGLCIVGEDESDGAFTIGGPRPELGNRFYQNMVAGVAVDLKDEATLSVDSMFNRIGRSAKQQTLVTNVGATLSLTGDTLQANHTLANTSFNILPNAAVPNLSQFAWDLSRPNNQGWEIDTSSIFYFPNIPFVPPLYQQLTGSGSQFLAQFGTDFSTQLQSVNGIDYNALQNLLPPVAFFPNGVPGYVTNLDRDIDGDQQLTLDFGNFTPVAPNNQFVWQMDTDRQTINNTSRRPDDSVIANQLAGTTARATFSGDFDGSGMQTTRTFDGTLFTDPNDPQGVLLNISAVVVSARSETDPAATGHGMQVVASGQSRITNFTSINDSIILNKGDGMTFSAHDDARIDSLTIQGANIEGNGGRGINIEAHDRAIVASSTIGGYDPMTWGQNILSGTSYTEGNRIVESGSDGVRVLAENGGQVNGNLINNTILGNGGNGASLIVDNGGTLNFGDASQNQLISRNMIMDNVGAGLRISSAVTPGGPAGFISALVQDNMFSGNQGGGIVSTMSGTGASNQIDLNIGGNAAQTNTIDRNSVVGVSFEVAGNGVGNFSIENASVTNTLGGDGIVLRRRDASLLTATVNNVSATGNALNGLLVDVSGSGKDNPAQPFSGKVNVVNWNNNNLSDNGQDGASFNVSGNAQLVADGENNVANSNGGNGVSIATSNTASFGDATGNEDFNMNGVLDPGEDQNGNGTIDILPPGRRVRLNGTTASNNGNDGINISAIDNSRVLVEITSNRTDPEAVGSHSGLNGNGDTNILNNGGDGIHIVTTGGQSDILITSGTGQTTIDGNGTTAGGNGIRWDASGDSHSTVRITNTDIGNSIAGLTENTATNGNGVLDPGEDLNGNGTLDPGEDGNGVLDVGEDLNNNGVLDPGEDRNSNSDVDVVDGDGIQANFTGNTDAVLIVGGVGEGNVIQSNDDDGIAITATGRTDARTTWFITPPAAVTPVDLTSAGFFGPVQKPTPIISIIGNTIGGEKNGVAQGNGGDGISINTLGGTEIGTLPANVDSTISVPPDFSDFLVSDNFGAIETGPIPKITISGNQITQNARRGANVLLTGAGGTRNRELGASEFDPIEITFTNNTISSNGAEGIFYRADSDMSQNRFVYLPNFPIVGPPANNNLNFSPFRSEFFALNNGSVNGNTSYLPPYLNLRTVQNSYLTVTGNTIQNNGTGGVTGEGLFIKVGTGSYVAGDIQNNVFGGNLEEDFRTASFVSADETFTSVDNTGDGTFDFIYLDDTAQLDLRFQTNSGNLIDPSSGGDSQVPAENLGATYTQFDRLKRNGFYGDINVLRRQTDLFQVDNGPGLNDPNNIFTTFGVTQNIQNAFSNGGYNLRAAADPMFPNIGFPPFLP